MVIKKTNGKFKLVSESSGRNLGTFKTRKAAKERDKQVTFFKNLAAGKIPCKDLRPGKVKQRCIKARRKR